MRVLVTGSNGFVGRRTSTARPTTALPPPVTAPAPALVEQALGKSGYFLSLPRTYALKTTDAADFLGV